MELQVFDLIMKEDQIEKFIDFLKKYAKEGYNIKAYWDDLIEQYGNTGSCYYEMSSHDSNDKNAHLFYYELTKRF